MASTFTDDDMELTATIVYPDNEDNSMASGGEINGHINGLDGKSYSIQSCGQGCHLWVEIDMATLVDEETAEEELPKPKKDKENEV